MVAGYAALVSSIAALFSSLSILGHSIALPSTLLAGRGMAASAARTTGIESAQGTAAYASAPFRQPALRYLYSVGWVGAASSPTVCKADLLFGDPVAAAVQVLRRNAALVARLSVEHVSTNEASEAIGRGFQEGCA